MRKNYQVPSLGNGCEAMWGMSMGMAAALEAQNWPVTLALEFIQMKYKYPNINQELHPTA